MNTHIKMEWDEFLILCVWNELQRVPATTYGKANCPHGFEIRVCENAAKEVDRLKEEGKQAIVYHFGGSGGGGFSR